MSEYLIKSETLESLANAIRAKKETNNTMTPVQMVDEIAGITTVQTLSWHQCPEIVRSYLAYVSDHPYSTSDWNVSYISDYAPSTPNVANTKPIGYVIDNATFTDNIPNVKTPFATASKAGTLTALDHLRWYNTYTANARDLGGWACDGGKVKYGMLVRGGLPNKTHYAEDKALMVDKIGIRSELQLYGGSDSQYSYEEGVSPWGIDWYGEKGYIWYTLEKRDLWTYILGVIFDSVLHSKPVYFHCGAGKDRTGTIAVMLLALLGVSQSDIDQDFELTTFATGSGSGITSRTGTDYKNFINSIHAYPLANGLADTLQNHAFSFVVSLGFSVDTVNNFRTACIDGTPSIIEPTLEVYTITKSGSHVTYDNDAASVTERQAYSVRVTADIGHAISDVSVTMGGTDITSQVFSGTPTVRRISVTNNLSHCSSSNSVDVAEEGTTYAATIIAAEGYTLDGATVAIAMGGTDITAMAYSNGNISIQSVTDNISIAITAVAEYVPPASYSVTNALTNCSTSNGSTSISDGSPYSATITPDSGYTLDGAIISITIGGNNVSQYYSNGTINIPSVTGDVVISVTAVESVPVNLFPGSFLDMDGVTVYNDGLGYKNNYRIRGTFAEDANSGSCVSGYLDVSGYTTLTISGCPDRGATSGYNIACYDSSFNGLSSETTTIGGKYTGNNNPNGTWTIPAGVKYIRFSSGIDPTNAVVYLS